MANDENDPYAPLNESEAFDSIWDALRWTQVKKRVPVAMRKTLRNRYFWANLVYLGYAIGILLIDFSTLFVEESSEITSNSSCEENFIDLTSTEVIDQPPGYTPVNIMYIVLGFVHLISASLYWWSWRDHRWNDVIMIPEYLNHIEADLYLWSAFWYTKEDGHYGYYTTRLHIIETTAAFVELFASFGWIMSWYRTYTRAIGRGYTLDDPDTVAYTLTTLSSFVYITYNVRILIYPDEYEENTMYYSGDIMYFVGAVFYLLASIRDDGWLWWFPVAGQYGIAPGRIETGKEIIYGLSHYPIGGVHPCTRCCRRRSSIHHQTPVKSISNGDHQTINQIKL